MRFAFATATAFLLAGCVIVEPPTAYKMNRLEVGMPQEQVIAEIGKPVSKGANSGGETWYYRFSETSSDALSGIKTAFSVRIVNGRVESFERMNDSNASLERALRAGSNSAPSCPPAPMCPPPPPPMPCICPAH
jgi:hypothetical protein